MGTEEQHITRGRSIVYNIILIVALGVFLCGEIYFGYRLQKESAVQEQIKEDYALSNSITFGLFSVDEWRERLIGALNVQVDGFSLTRAQKRNMQVQVQAQLHSLVHKAVAEMNKPQKSLIGKLKKFAFNTIVDTVAVYQQVPSFAHTIVARISSPASINRLKDIANSKINQLKRQTYDSTSIAIAGITKYLYLKYHVSDPTAYNNEINKRLAAIRVVTYNYAYWMLGCVAAALLLWLLMRKQVHLYTSLFVMSLLFASVLLIVGVTTTIIEVDARIQTFNFVMMGQKVEFLNQVLFFQSKSLMGVIHTLLKQPKPDAVVVGSIIFLFVIILPAVRLLARAIHILSPKSIAENRALRYLAFESGKWDMADVMVLGILMTYIGLNGILKSQLSNLDVNAGGLRAITSNNTALQPGYFIFAGYVIFEMILSYILRRITPHDVKETRRKMTRRLAFLASNDVKTSGDAS